MTDMWPNSKFKMPISSSIMLKKFYENVYTQLKRKNILFVRSKISLNQASTEFKNLSSPIRLPSNFGMPCHFILPQNTTATCVFHIHLAKPLSKQQVNILMHPPWRIPKYIPGVIQSVNYINYAFPRSHIHVLCLINYSFWIVKYNLN